MIIKDKITINGTTYDRTYSDSGMKIERDGALYDEAVDPLDSGREYTETDVSIESYNEDAKEDDYIEALGEFGVETREKSDDEI